MGLSRVHLQGLHVGLDQRRSTLMWCTSADIYQRQMQMQNNQTFAARNYAKIGILFRWDTVISFMCVKNQVLKVKQQILFDFLRSLVCPSVSDFDSDSEFDLNLSEVGGRDCELDLSHSWPALTKIHRFVQTNCWSLFVQTNCWTCCFCKLITELNLWSPLRF